MNIVLVRDSYIERVWMDKGRGLIGVLAKVTVNSFSRTISSLAEQRELI